MLYHEISSYQPLLSLMTYLLLNFTFCLGYVLVWVNAMCVQTPMKSGGVGGTRGYEQPNVDARNCTWVLRESRKYL